MKKIDRITIIELDGKVLARCYTGNSFMDAELTPEALAVTIADGAKVLCGVIQRRESAKAL